MFSIPNANNPNHQMSQFLSISVSRSAFSNFASGAHGRNHLAQVGRLRGRIGAAQLLDAQTAGAHQGIGHWMGKSSK